MSVQVAVIGSGGEYESQAEEIGGLLAERGLRLSPVASAR